MDRERKVVNDHLNPRPFFIFYLLEQAGHHAAGRTLEIAKLFDRHRGAGFAPGVNSGRGRVFERCRLLGSINREAGAESHEGHEANNQKGQVAFHPLEQERKTIGARMPTILWENPAVTLGAGWTSIAKM